MPAFTIKTANGPVTVEGRKFSHYIKNVQFWFFYHSDELGNVTVSHVKSGLKITNVQRITIQAFLRDTKGAAKHSIDLLADRVGVDVLYAKLKTVENQ